MIGAAVAAAGIAVALAGGLGAIGRLLPRDRLVQLNGLRFGYRVEREVRIAMPDGVRLAASLYLPRSGAEKLATVLVRVPYGRLEYGEALNSAEKFARLGYAVLVEDLRGTHGSEGVFVPYRSGESDGVATLDWIVAQPWSNGRVGTFGCSALGETQFVLGRARHPALRAMIPLGAGGAVGSRAGRHAYFGVYEGGIFELASGFGWFLENGAKDPHQPLAQATDIAAALRGLPVADLVARHRPGPNGYDDLMKLQPGDPAWHALGYLSDADVIDAPTLEITTWGDQTVGDTLAVDASLRGRGERHLVIAPGTHCHAEETGASGRFGEIGAANAAQPWAQWYERWFDHWLRDRGDGLARMPAVRYYMLGEQRWHDAPAWPPPQAASQRWYLDGGGRANGAGGDGVLATAAPAALAADIFVHDPMHPVPSRGGPVCCTGDPAVEAGPADQRSIEARADVLVYTSPPLLSALRIAGRLHAVLEVTSSAPDTDFIARLVDVWPDGRATSIQEGALRARYRDGFDRPRWLVPGQPARLDVDMRAIAYALAPGHRLRLDIASSSFPRLERNLGIAGDNARAATGVQARNSVRHGGLALSYVELQVLPAATD